MGSFAKALIGVTLLTLTGCSPQSALQSSLVGTYIAADPRYGVMLQISSAESSRVEGLITAVEALPNGRVTAATKPISGIRDGNSLTLSVQHPPGNSPATTPVNGIILGDQLRLTFFAHGNANSLTFQRGNAEAFAQVVETVRLAAADTTAARVR